MPTPLRRTPLVAAAPLTSRRGRASRSAIATALALALFSAVLGLAPASAAAPPASDVAAARAEAARIAAQLERLGREVSIQAERFNEARLALAELEQREQAAASGAARAAATAEEVRGRLRDQAVTAYVRGGSAQALAMLIDAGREDLAVRQQYVSAVLLAGRELAAEAKAAEAQLRREQADLVEAKREAEAGVAEADAARRQADAAASAQRAVLARVEGELAQLVASERAALAAAEAARAQEELERRRREAPAATPTTTAPRRPTTTAAPSGPRTPAPTPAPSTSAPRATTTTTAKPSEPTGSAPAQAPGAATAVAEAKRQIGKPYEWGGSGPDTFDCSGLTAWAWRAGGRSLPHSSRAQRTSTVPIRMDQIAPGDLLFYGDPIHHVGIYVGDGRMVEASQTGTPVRYASIYRRDLVGIGRVT